MPLPSPSASLDNNQHTYLQIKPRGPRWSRHTRLPAHHQLASRSVGPPWPAVATGSAQAGRNRGVQGGSTGSPSELRHRSHHKRTHTTCSSRRAYVVGARERLDADGADDAAKEMNLSADALAVQEPADPSGLCTRRRCTAVRLRQATASQLPRRSTSPSRVPSESERGRATRTRAA